MNILRRNMAISLNSYLLIQIVHEGGASRLQHPGTANPSPHAGRNSEIVRTGDADGEVPTRLAHADLHPMSLHFIVSPR